MKSILNFLGGPELNQHQMWLSMAESARLGRWEELLTAVTLLGHCSDDSITRRGLDSLLSTRSTARLGKSAGWWLPAKREPPQWPQFAWPVPVSKIIHPVAARLRLPGSLRVYSTPLISSDWQSDAEHIVPTLQLSLPRILDGDPVNDVNKLPSGVGGGECGLRSGLATDDKTIRCWSWRKGTVTPKLLVFSSHFLFCCDFQPFFQRFNSLALSVFPLLLLSGLPLLFPPVPHHL